MFLSIIIIYGWRQMWIKSDKTNYVPAYARDGVGAVSYRMLECPEQIVIAQVDDKGLLSSGSLTGISSLLVTSQETFGVNQTLVLAVKVSLRTAVCWGLTIGYSVMLKHFQRFLNSSHSLRKMLSLETFHHLSVLKWLPVISLFFFLSSSGVAGVLCSLQCQSCSLHTHQREPESLSSGLGSHLHSPLSCQHWRDSAQFQLPPNIFHKQVCHHPLPVVYGILWTS